MGGLGSVEILGPTAAKLYHAATFAEEPFEGQADENCDEEWVATPEFVFAGFFEDDRRERS